MIDQRLIRQKKPRKPTTESAGAESAAIHGVISAMMSAFGRGGLTWISKQIEMTPSAARKRLSDPERAFDEQTMRAVILVTSSRADRAPEDSTLESTTITDNLEIQIRIVNGIRKPYWKAHIT